VKNDEKNIKQRKPLTSVMEDYLEAIFDLGREKRVVRVKDIAKRLGVKMPTVTSMLKNLSQRGLVNYEKYEYVELTQKGASVGREMRRRHETLRRFLTEILKIDPDIAGVEACKMEHVLGAATMKSLTRFMEFIQLCPRTGEGWLDRFEEYKRNGRSPEKCQERVDQFSCEFRERIDSLVECESCKET
jgi:DtxR family Mn-dependent transcriptional regulator